MEMYQKLNSHPDFYLAYFTRNVSKQAAFFTLMVSKLQMYYDFSLGVEEF